jgi:sensor histidine kinase YesM
MGSTQHLLVAIFNSVSRYSTNPSDLFGDPFGLQCLNSGDKSPISFDFGRDIQAIRLGLNFQPKQIGTCFAQLGTQLIVAQATQEIDGVFSFIHCSINLTIRLIDDLS